MFGLLLLPILPVICAASYARSRWHTSILQQGKIQLRSGLTAADAARHILAAAQIQGVTIVERAGFYTNRYDPRTHTLLLSPSMYHGKNAASIGLALHEIGHAIQQAKNDTAYPLRLTAIGASRFFPGALLLLIIPSIFHLIPIRLTLLAISLGWFGLFIWNIATLQTEHRANKLVRNYAQHTKIYSNPQEEDALNHAMAAAAWIRVGDYINALQNFFYHLLPLHKKG